MSILFDRADMLRQQQDMSVYALEKAADLTEGSFRYWKESMPSGDKILRVANALNASVDYLLGNSDNPLSHKNNPSNVAPAIAEFQSIIDQMRNFADELGVRALGLLSDYQLETELEPTISKETDDK